MADTLNTNNVPKAKRTTRKVETSTLGMPTEPQSPATASDINVYSNDGGVTAEKKTVKDTVLKGAASAKAAALKATENVDWKAQGDQIKEQAAKTARAAADVAKDTTGGAMHSLSKLIADTAGTVDSKLGPQYGDYARYAAEAVAGAAKSLDAKDVDQLVGDARDFVRKSPAVAIGAAAVVGYVLMRLAKGSGSDEA